MITSWYVSTPVFTIRVDVTDGRILPTSARYIFRAYGPRCLLHGGERSGSGMARGSEWSGLDKLLN